MLKVWHEVTCKQLHYLGTDVGPEDWTGEHTSGVPQVVAATLLQALSVGETELAHLGLHLGPHHLNLLV